MCHGMLVPEKTVLNTRLPGRVFRHLPSSGSVEECLTRDREAAGSSHVVVLEQDTFILA